MFERLPTLPIRLINHRQRQTAQLYIYKQVYFEISIGRLAIIGLLPKIHKMCAIAGFGNSLLDISARIENDEILKKYSLKANDQRELPESEMNALYHDISNLTLRFSPGGCAQNTLRVMQWLIQKPNNITFFGCIGNDKIGKKLSELVADAKLCTRYMVHPVHPTGICIALINEANRSLVANLGASPHYSIDHLKQHLVELESVNMIYLEGYFLPNRFDVAGFIKQFCISKDKILVFNLSGSYLCKALPKEVEEYASASHIVFGNKNEFKTLGTLINEPDPKKLALKLNKNYPNSNCRFGKTVIITDGSEDVVCVHGDGVVTTMPVPFIPRDQMKDTTGAGDSFVAGFLAAYSAGLGVGKCLHWGCWTASQIIGRVGCTTPDYPPGTIE